MAQVLLTLLLVSYTPKGFLIFSQGTRAQHLTLSVCAMCNECVTCDVWCPLDGCDALIGQPDNCTGTISAYSTCVHQAVGKVKSCIQQEYWPLHGFSTMAISWGTFILVYYVWV